MNTYIHKERKKEKKKESGEKGVRNKTEMKT